MEIVLLLVVFIISSCAVPVEEELPDEAKILLWLDKADPVEKFERAVSVSDYRFIGIYGEGPEVPAVNMDCIDLKKDVNYIEGTTDAILGDEHFRLIELANVYTQEYNGKMLNYLKENHDFKCET